MNKNNWLFAAALGTFLGAFLSAGQCVQAQAPPRAKTGVGSAPAPLTPALAAAMTAEGPLAHAAAVDLHLGNYIQAEEESREALSLTPDGVPAEVLAAALDAQGKDQEALQAYQTVVEHYDKQPRNLLPYAQLLLKSGQWAQAVAVYNEALPHLGNGELEKETSGFTPEVPQPAALATAIHWSGETLQRNCGLGRRTAKHRGDGGVCKSVAACAGECAGELLLQRWLAQVKPGGADQVRSCRSGKAALQKAAQLGDPTVKKMAEAALKKPS